MVEISKSLGKRGRPDGIVGKLIGDSRLNNSHAVAGSFDTEAANGIAFFVGMLSRGRVRFPSSLNFGVISDTTDMILARKSTWLAAPASFSIFFASTNDTALLSNTLAQRKANLTTIVTDLQASGIPVIVVPELPRTSFATSQLKQHLSCAQHLRNMHDPANGIFVADPWLSLVQQMDATNAAPISGMFYDGLHQAPAGSYYIAVEIVKIISMLFPEPMCLLPSSNADVYDATDNPLGTINANPMLDGTSGTAGTGVTGDVATSHTMQSSTASLTATASKVPSGGKTWQQMALGGTPNVANPTMAFLLGGMSTSKLVTGRIYEPVCEIEVDAGASGLLVPYLQVALSGVTYNTGYPLSVTTGRMPSFAFGGVMRGRRFAAPASLSGFQMMLGVFGVNGETASGTVRVARMALKEVASL